MGAFDVVSCFDGQNHCFKVVNGENSSKKKIVNSSDERIVCHLTPFNEHEKHVWIIDMFV